MSVHLLRPREKPRAAELHVSYSQLFTYMLCPMKYGHNYVWGTPAESKPLSMIFGRAIHAAAERYYRAIMETGEILPVNDLEHAFEVAFALAIKRTDVRISFKKGETIAGARAQGKELLALFHSQVRPQRIIAVEEPFSVSVPDMANGGDLPYQLVGYFDLIESDDEACMVGELKTSAQKFSTLKLEYDLQPTVYSYAMSRMEASTTRHSCLIRYDVLVKTKTAIFEQYFVTRTEDDHQRLIHLINHVMAAIENRVFYRNMGWQCIDCQFKTACLG